MLPRWPPVADKKDKVQVDASVSARHRLLMLGCAAARLSALRSCKTAACRPTNTLTLPQVLMQLINVKSMLMLHHWFVQALEAPQASPETPASGAPQTPSMKDSTGTAAKAALRAPGPPQDPQNATQSAHPPRPPTAQHQSAAWPLPLLLLLASSRNGRRLGRSLWHT